MRRRTGRDTVYNRASLLLHSSWHLMPKVGDAGPRIHEGDSEAYLSKAED